MLRKSVLIVGVFLIVVLQMVFCWSVDISASILMNHKESTLTNGFGVYSPLVVYHLSLYGLILSFVVQVVLWIFIISKEKNRDG